MDKSLISRYPALRFLLCAAFVFMVSGCASNKPQINMDEAQNFSAIRTFSVEPPLNAVNPTIENYLRTTITDVMTAKGLIPESPDEADVKVAFLPSTARKEDGKSVSFGLGTGSFGRSGGISLGSIFTVPVGEQVSVYQNLQIDVIKDGQFIYSATGSAELEKSDSISIQQSLTELVGELLASYPVNQ